MEAGNLQTDLAMRAEIDLYYDLFVPPNLNGKAPLLIAVHGYGAHKRYMMREARSVAGDRFVIASVQAPHEHFRRTDSGYRVGFGWLTDHKAEASVRLHHKFLLDVIGEVNSRGSIDETRVVLLGFSQACALNFRFAFSSPGVLRAVVGICGGIPGDLETNPAYTAFDAETFYLYADDDEFYTAEKLATFDAALANRIENYRSKRYAAKHEITDEMRDDIRKFLLSI